MNFGWNPISESDLRKASEDGILDENTVRVEFKQQLPKNERLAEELASLALDGGSLLVGIIDAKHRTPGDPASALNPLNLEGLDEKIENIASMTTPPIAVFPRLIRSTADETKGYLWVDIPQSPLAPHMVDGRYWGRNGGSKQILTDDQVRLYITRQQRREDLAASELDRFVKRHPPGRFTAEEDERTGSIHIVAAPLTGRDEMAQQVFETTNPLDLVCRLLGEIPQNLRQLSDFEVPRHSSRIADGYAVSPSRLVNGQPEFTPNKFNVFEISEDGVVRFHHHRIAAFTRNDISNQETQWLFPNPTFGSGHITLALIGLLSETLNYTGSWSIAVVVSDIEGAIAYSNNRDVFQTAAYTESTYRRTTTASTLELRRAPGAATNRLLGRLARAIQVDKWNDINIFLGDQSAGSTDDPDVPGSP